MVLHIISTAPLPGVNKAAMVLPLLQEYCVDIESRCRLRSGSSSALLVPTTRRRTLGDRAFAVAGARVYSLPVTLTSQPSLLMFRGQLKTLLFEQSFS